MANSIIEKMSREDLLRIIDIYAKNWLAMDGVWFQSIEKKFGMDEAVEHDENAWRQFTVIEANRIKDFLDLPEQAGLDGLKKALGLRMYANINADEILIKENTLTYRTLDCRVQNARKRKGMEFHPCKSVGMIEYTFFAKTIDSRIECEAISCYPDVTDETCNCSWKFTLRT
jgi:hypothetical protein